MLRALLHIQWIPSCKRYTIAATNYYAVTFPLPTAVCHMPPVWGRSFRNAVGGRKENFSARALYFREWLQCSGCQGKTFLVAHGQWPHSLYPCNTQTQTHRHTNTGAQIQTMFSFLMYTSYNKETHNTTTKTQTIVIFLNLVKLTRRMWIKLKGNNHT